MLQIDLENPAPATVILAPGDMILDELVQEPLDLALVDLSDNQGIGLLVLDRVGDVYQFFVLKISGEKVTIGHLIFVVPLFFASISRIQVLFILIK